jgi:hypothetical protein
MIPAVQKYTTEHHEKDDFLVSDDNPILNLSAEEEAFLLQLCEATGTEGQRVETYSTRISDQIVRGKGEKGVVVCFEQEYIALAQQYAHLTDRSFQFCEATTDLLHITRLEMVVVPLHHLSGELFGAITSNANAPGLLTASTVQEMRMIAVKYAMQHKSHLSLNKKVSRLNTSLVDEGVEQYAVFDTRGQELSTTVEDVNWLLSDHNAFEFIGHSDGIDASFGKMVLCGVSREASLQQGELSPSCIANNYCHRLSIPLEETKTSNKIIFPQQLSADLLVLTTCWGINLRKKAFDARHGFARQFLLNPSIGPMLSTWKIAKIKHDTSDQLWNYILNTETLGSGLRAFTASNCDEGPGALAYCILGDPNIQTSSTLNCSTKKIEPDTQADQALTSRQIDDLQFLRYYFMEQINEPTGSEEMQALAMSQFEHIYNAELRLAKGDMVPNLLAEIRSGTADYLMQRGFYPKLDWSKFSQHFSHLSNEACSCCGNSSPLFEYSLIPSQISKRQTLECDHCGLVKDCSEEHVDATISFEDGTVLISNLEFPEDGLLAIILYTPIKKDRMVWKWEYQGTTICDRKFELPTSQFPNGNFVVSVCTMVGAQAFNLYNFVSNNQTSDEN